MPTKDYIQKNLKYKWSMHMYIIFLSVMELQTVTCVCCYRDSRGKFPFFACARAAFFCHCLFKRLFSHSTSSVTLYSTALTWSLTEWNSPHSNPWSSHQDGTACLLRVLKRFFNTVFHWFWIVVCLLFILTVILNALYFDIREGWCSASKL